MSFQTGSATDLDDLFDKLATFAVANGWTEDEDETNDTPAFSRGNVFVQFRYDGSSPAARRSVAMYQALAYDGVATVPGAHTDDSGNGFSSASPSDFNLKGQRCISDMGDGPFPNYWFFEDDSDVPYIHVVVEIATDEFRHFGFGNIKKFGTWTGGEYVYGHSQDTGTNGARATTASVLLDGLMSDISPANEARKCATLHMEGLPGMGASEKWGQVWGNSTSIPNDRAGQDKMWVQGGFRAGPVARFWGNFNGTSLDGLIPGYQIALFYVDLDNSHAYYLGHQLDVRGVNVRHFTPRQEVVIGSDTWVFFPMSIRTATLTVPLSSAYSGIMYRKVTT